MKGAGHFTLVTALIVPEEPGDEECDRLQLGPLCIAASARAIGYEVAFVNLNTLSAAFQRGGLLIDQERFLRHAAEAILAHDNAFIGLSTICSSFRLTLRLVQRIKQTRPEAFVFLGGPQATAVDEQALAAVPELDAVLRGEADFAIRALLAALGEGSDLGAVPGLTWREAGGEVVRNAPAELIADLDAVPFPAYDLYPAELLKGGIAIDAGRGCPFECIFCSTNEFFSRRFRMKSPERLAWEITTLHERYGARAFSLTHDLFTTNVKTVRAICKVFRERIAIDGFEWSASSRIDSMKDGLAAEMAAAGCRNLFFGVETGSAEMQRQIKKRLTVSRIYPVLEECSQLGIECTASLIIGYPDEGPQDLDATLRLAVEAVRLPNVKSQIHLLVPLPGTPLAVQHAAELTYSDLNSNIATIGGTALDEAERGFLRANPAIFTQHFYVPNRHFGRRELFHIAQLTFFGAAFFRHTVIAVHQLLGGFTACAMRWSAWIDSRLSIADHLLEGFYRDRAFKEAFASFVCELSAELPADEGELLATILRFDAQIGRHLGGAYADEPGRAACSGVAAFDLDNYPVLARGVSLGAFAFEMHEVLTGLRAGELRPSRHEGETWYLFTDDGRGRVNFAALDPTLGAVLAHCDGERTLLQAMIRANVPAAATGALLTRLAVMLDERLVVALWSPVGADEQAAAVGAETTQTVPYEP